MSTRKLSLIGPVIGDLLIKQIGHEIKNYNLYKSFANFFGLEGIVSLEKYYNKRAEEELTHSEWIYSYLTDADYAARYPAIEENKEVWEQYIDPFKLTVDREIQTTELIYNIYETAIKLKDYMTTSWLFEKLIEEQIEEENVSRMALAIMEEDSDIFIKSKEVLKLLQ